MADGETSGLVGEVSLSASLQVAEGVAAQGMESEEPEESGHSDDDEDEDEINHSALPKETVRVNTPKEKRLSPQAPVFSLQGLLQLPQDLWVQGFRVCKWARMLMELRSTT